MDISPSRPSLQESSPVGAEAGLAGIIRSPAPEKFAPDSSQPDRAEIDPRPDGHHHRMEQESVVEPVAERTKESESRHRDQCHRGQADPVAHDRKAVGKEMKNQAPRDDQEGDDVVAAAE